MLRAMEVLGCHIYGFACPTSSEAPLTIALPDHICLPLLEHTRGKHSRVAFVHCVRDLVGEQLGCRVDGGRGQRSRAAPPVPPDPRARLTSGAVVYVEDTGAPRPRAAHAGEDAHQVGGLGEAVQRDPL